MQMQPVTGQQQQAFYQPAKSSTGDMYMYHHHHHHQQQQQQQQQSQAVNNIHAGYSTDAYGQPVTVNDQPGPLYNNDQCAFPFYNTPQGYGPDSQQYVQSTGCQNQPAGAYQAPIRLTTRVSPKASCSSPRAFRVDSDGISFMGSPVQRHDGQHSPRVVRVHPMGRPTSSSSVASLMQSSGPLFHDYNPQTSQPFRQEHTSMSDSLPSQPALNTSQGSIVGNIVQMFMPGYSNLTNPGGDTPQGSVPLHQVRFGYPEDDLPLLEELGISPHKIRVQAMIVLNPLRAMAHEVIDGMDLAGPIVFAVLLAIFLSLRGNIQFNTIYGHFVLGIIFTKVLLSLMTDNGVPLQFVISALGYCLIPNVLLAAFQSLVYWLLGYVGKNMLLPALLCVLWSAWCATAMFVGGLGMEKQRYLILYPMFLFYAVFATLTIF
ncbi:hypothetical protein TRVL_06346 [Trypanosoma vivax]|nr:hypothetical protein TRVL_06346 [Trypanosoma vivax]